MEATVTKNTKGSTIVIVILLLVIIGGGIFWYIRNNKKKSDLVKQNLPNQTTVTVSDTRSK